MFKIVFYTLMTFFIFVCLIMILLVLIVEGPWWRPRLRIGGGGSNTAFGSKTGDVLTWATSIVFGVFVLVAVILNMMANNWPTN